MKRSLAVALALVAVVTGFRAASAQQQSAQCGDFVKLRDEMQQRAAAVKAATMRKADRKEICTLVTNFVNTQLLIVKFLEDNKSWCGVPDQAITGAKADHAQAMKFRVVACTDAPEAKPKAPSLSDAIGTPTVDTSKNTKTGHGTFDTLTGNPLAK